MNTITTVNYWSNGTCTILYRTQGGDRRRAYGNSAHVYDVLMRYFCHVPGVGYVSRKAGQK